MEQIAILTMAPVFAQKDTWERNVKKLVHPTDMEKIA